MELGRWQNSEIGSHVEPQAGIIDLIILHGRVVDAFVQAMFRCVLVFLTKTGIIGWLNCMSKIIIVSVVQAMIRCIVVSLSTVSMLNIIFTDNFIHKLINW